MTGVQTCALPISTNTHTHTHTTLFPSHDTALKIAVDIKAWADQYRPRQICYDKYTAQSIADKLTHSGQICQDVSGAAFYQACGELNDALNAKRLVHAGQENWIQQMNNCAAKTNDSAWRIVKRKSAGDVSGAIATAMVVHLLS